MLNYEVDARILARFVPAGTEMDTWEGRTFVSIIGFLFLDTRLRGLAVPFHRSFEEVNLRFYVRRRADEGWRRAVVFIRELVPRALIAWTARVLYNENYTAVRMGHRLQDASETDRAPTVTYWWGRGDARGELNVRATGGPAPLVEGSREEFIAEHYWGYARQRDGGTLEYRVEHPRWKVWAAADATLRCDVRTLYGPSFVEALSGPPASAFVAEGSAVTVYAGTRLKD